MRMHVSQEDAAIMYARACRAWYGKRASNVVADKLRELQRRGDAGGVAAWGRVALALSQSKKLRHHSRAALGKLY
jgi:hypothetical protein